MASACVFVSGSSTGFLVLKQSQSNTNSVSFTASSSCNYSYIRRRIRAEGSMTTKKLGIKVERNPPESKLSRLGVRKWPKWGCPASKFPWTYTSKETCFLLEGKVKVYPEGSDDFVEIGAGDLVEFPNGMTCTWEVSVAVDKHYNFE